MAGEKGSRYRELWLSIARGGAGAPLHAQIERGLREAIRAGRLAAGSPVPSTRSLAKDLGVSRGVVVEAYEQLTAEGYLETRPAARTIVASRARSAADEVGEPASRFRFDFRPGLPDLTLFPRSEWSRAARRVFRDLRPEQLGYCDPAGSPELRSALSDYLGRVRATLCRPRSLLVCSGCAQALRIAARVLVRQGIDRIAIEDPGHADRVPILTAAGVTPVAVRVDDRGLRVDELDRERVRAVLVSPAHQFPTGSVLAPERRRELAAWADRRSAFVIEDDYDAEYRYDRSPPGSLQGANVERVIYAGSSSKLLAPALRLGWIVFPQSLLASAVEEKRLFDLGTPFIEQLVFAEFLRSGGLDRHLRKVRGIYRERRDALLNAIQTHFPRWVPEGAAAGLHLAVSLPDDVDEADLVRRAERCSVRLYPMSRYRSDGSSLPASIVMGYAPLTPREIGRGISLLAATAP